MEMIIIASDQQKRIVMLFSESTTKMSDKAIINDLDSYKIKSSDYLRFKTARDLLVERIRLPIDDKSAKLEGGDFLYRYLSKGYVCLGEYKGKPKPDLTGWGVRNIRILHSIGFGL